MNLADARYQIGRLRRIARVHGRLDGDETEQLFDLAEELVEDLEREGADR